MWPLSTVFMYKYTNAHFAGLIHAPDFTTRIVDFILLTTITQSYDYPYDTYLHNLMLTFLLLIFFYLFQNQKIKNTSILNFSITSNTCFHWLLFTVKFNCHMYFLIGWNLRCPLCTNKISF
jgi:hypothetical protein